MIVRALIVSCWLLWSLSAAAVADEKTEVAKRHDAAATKLFNLGRFKEAAAEYEKAYQARPMPVFLYNLGQCYKRMGAVEHLSRALFYLESYLQNSPGATDRAEVEAEIDQLKKQIADLKAARPDRQQPASAPTTKEAPPPRAVAPPPAAPGPAPTPARRFYQRWWFWTAGAAVASLGAAVGLTLAAEADYSEAERLGSAAADYPRWNDVKDAGQAKELAANILFGVGGALAATSAVLFFVERRRDERPARGAQLRLRVVPLSTGLSVTGDF